MQSGKWVAGLGDERPHAFWIFHENGFGMAGADVVGLLSERIGGVERRRDGTIREYAQIGEIEFSARLGMQRYRVTLSDSQLAEAASNFLRGALVVKPRVTLVIALARRLMQSRRVAESTGGFFEDSVHGASAHSPIVDVLRCGLYQTPTIVNTWSRELCRSNVRSS